ncbi:uncharacterized protein LOC109845850 [Asparagus officinalis]|uniref:uncharacterized protein LOC109845850 n=1 Tax=Asparagus officinalis TaxID=4686 RepID=UPI00098E772A|nr:uncharacterized protein LOC109845850 [Asparagus officinalis]
MKVSKTAIYGISVEITQRFLAGHFGEIFLYKRKTFTEVQILGKCAGVVGNYNAHKVAYPDIDWPTIAAEFMTSLGLGFNPYIEPLDYIAKLFNVVVQFNNIQTDFDQDIWSYISLGYFKQDVYHLPISRMQRDLTDSTVLRNLGIGSGYSLLAYKSTLQGIRKLQVNVSRLNEDLDQVWEVLVEPIQTVMHRYNVPEAYEKLKDLTRGRVVSKESIQKFTNVLQLPEEAKCVLLNLNPQSYIGEAEKLSKSIDDHVDLVNGFRLL